MKKLKDYLNEATNSFGNLYDTYDLDDDELAITPMLISRVFNSRGRLGNDGFKYTWHGVRAKYYQQHVGDCAKVYREKELMDEITNLDEYCNTILSEIDNDTSRRLGSIQSFKLDKLVSTKNHIEYYIIPKTKRGRKIWGDWRRDPVFVKIIIERLGMEDDEYWYKLGFVCNYNNENI